MPIPPSAAVTGSLAFLGDSTLDFGNLDATARSLGQRRPFRQSRYDGGGNVKASDGFTLGEQIARQLGAGSRRSPGRLRSAELINLSDEPLRRGLPEKDPRAQVFNFAYAGATSGGRGSRTAGLRDFRIGLQRQAATLAEASGFLPHREGLDVIISGGSNDVFDFLDANANRIQRVLLTPSRRDDRRLANRVAGRIVSNIDSALDTITGLYDGAVVLGLGPLSATPRVRSASKQFRRVPLLGRSLRSEFRRFVDRISMSVNSRLDRKYNASDNNGILFVDGVDAWRSVRSPGFVDTIHPDSATNNRLARFAVEQINASPALDTFGF